MKKEIKIITALAVSVATLSCAAGITYATLTRDSQSNVGVSSADLDLFASASNLRAYSAVLASDQDTDVFTDEHGKKYKYVQCYGDTQNSVNFNGGGSVKLESTSVTVDKMKPGDKVEFDIEVTSTSTISFNYRAELYLQDELGKHLAEQMQFSAGTLGLYRQDEQKAAILTDYTEWKTYPANQSAIEKVHVSMALPITANDECQDEKLTVKYVARGEQNTESLPYLAQIGEQKFKALTEAVSYAQANDVKDIKIIGSTTLEEGTVEINRAMNFVGETEGDELPVLKGARIIVKDGASVSFANIAFKDASYIDVSGATSFDMTNCLVSTSALRYYDASARSYIPDSAFLVSGSVYSDVLLNLKNNRFRSAGSAAVYMGAELSDKSEISNNVFDPENGYNGTAAVSLNGARQNAVVLFNDNTVHAKTALSLGEKASNRFTVRSTNNKVYSAQMFVSGNSGAVLDNGTTLSATAEDGANVTLDKFASTLLFAGINTKLDSMGKTGEGNYALYNLTVQDFYTNYVAVGTLAPNAITVTVDDGTYYLNKNDNDEYQLVAVQNN